MYLAQFITGIDNVFFEVGDLRKARHFYEEVLGFKVAFEAPQIKSCGYIVGREIPGLGVGEVENPRPSRLWVEVTDVLTARENLAADISLVQDVFDIRTGKVFIISDPWGNQIGFTDYSYIPEKGRQ